MSQPRLLLVQRDPERAASFLVSSPGVGDWVEPPRPGTRLAPGDPAGRLVVLRRAHLLQVPAPAQGCVEDVRSRGRRTPVAHGDLLFRLAPAQTAEGAAPERVAEDPEVPEGCLALRAPIGGTVYWQPAPGAAAFVEPGSEVESASRLLIIEAMKVMNEIRLRDVPGAPPRARVHSLLLENASPVEVGTLLLVLEPL